MAIESIHLHPNKMSKKSYERLMLLIPAIVFVVVLLVLVNLSVANVGAATDLAETVRARIEQSQEIRLELREKIRSRVEERVATNQARMTERVQNRVRLLLGMTIARTEAVINRMNTLITRVDSRLEKQGVENSHLEEAQKLVTEAASTLEELKASVEVLVNSDNPREVWGVVKESFGSIKTSLVEAHRILVSIMGEIE